MVRVRAWIVVGVVTCASLVVAPMRSPVGAIAAATLTPVPTGVDPAATAVLANITMVNGAAAGYVTADACTALRPGAESTSTGNHGVGAAVANLAVVPVDADRQFCIVSQAPVDLIADVQGYLAPASAGGLVYRVGTGRHGADTRTSSTGQPRPGTITRIETGVPSGTAAVLANITMVNGTSVGYVTADACSILTAGEQSRSNGNHGVATAVSNLSVVPVDADGSLCIFNQRAVDLVVDIQGSFVGSAPDGLGFDSVTGRRAVDTRIGPGSRPTAGTITTVRTGAPAGAVAVLANITMVDGAGAGYVTAGECSTMNAGDQDRSSGNHVGATAVSNLAVVPVAADGTFCIFNQSPVDLTVDIQGAFSANGSQHFFPVTSTRALDTRPPSPAPSATPRTSCSSVVHIGDSTSVGLISPSIIKDPALRMPAQYARVGVTDPRMEISGARSIVETLSGQMNAYDVAVAIKRSGYRGCWVFALGTTDTANIAAGSGPGRAARIHKMMDLVAGDPVMWLTTKSFVSDGPWAASNMQLWNNAMTQLAPNYPNLQIYDWAAVAQRAWFSGDLIHYSVEGYTIRAGLIADALTVAFPG